MKRVRPLASSADLPPGPGEIGAWKVDGRSTANSLNWRFGEPITRLTYSGAGLHLEYDQNCPCLLLEDKPTHVLEYKSP